MNKLPIGSSSTLIVVDVQNCFVDGGTLPVADGAEVIPVINGIAPLFENIVVTQDWHTKGHSSFASSHQGKKPFDVVSLPYGQQVLWPDHGIQGTPDAELHKDLKLPTAQLIIRKGYRKDIDSYSAFMEADRKTTTGLAAYLHAHQIDTGFNVYVIEDACRGINLNGSVQLAWNNMTESGVKRIHSGELS